MISQWNEPKQYVEAAVVGQMSQPEQLLRLVGSHFPPGTLPVRQIGSVRNLLLPESTLRRRARTPAHKNHRADDDADDGVDNLRVQVFNEVDQRERTKYPFTYRIQGGNHLQSLEEL